MKTFKLLLTQKELNFLADQLVNSNDLDRGFIEDEFCGLDAKELKEVNATIRMRSRLIRKICKG